MLPRLLLRRDVRLMLLLGEDRPPAAAPSYSSSTWINSMRDSGGEGAGGGVRGWEVAGLTDMRAGVAGMGAGVAGITAGVAGMIAGVAGIGMGVGDERMGVGGETMRVTTGTGVAGLGDGGYRVMLEVE